MATIRAYTTIEQSRKLAEILPIESADMCYIQDLLAGCKYGEYKPYIGDLIPAYGQGKIRCWSLASLIGVLPRFIEFKDNKYYLRFMKEYVEYANDEISITGRCLHTTGNNNLVDACVEMIEKLHKQNLL